MSAYVVFDNRWIEGTVKYKELAALLSDLSSISDLSQLFSLLCDPR